MKKELVLLVLCLGLWSVSYAQKFGYIDADFILSKMPAYQKAQQDVQGSATKWQSDIDDKMAKVKEMWQKYQTEEILLTEEMKVERKAT